MALQDRDYYHDKHDEASGRRGAEKVRRAMYAPKQFRAPRESSSPVDEFAAEMRRLESRRRPRARVTWLHVLTWLVVFLCVLAVIKGRLLR